VAKEAEESRQKRKEGIGLIQSEHQRWQEEQEAHELANLKASGVLEPGEAYPVPNSVFTEMDWDDTLESAYQRSVKELYAQRATDEANEAERLQKMKQEREDKARQLKDSVHSKLDADARGARDKSYEIKKQMGAQTVAQRQAEEGRQAELRKRGAEERKKNDAYDEWLAKDHIRTIAERSHERADPSKMHEGAKFDGIPTDFTPGK